MKRDLNLIETVNPVCDTHSQRTDDLFCLTIVYHPDLDRIGERSYLFEQNPAPVALSRLEPLFSAIGGSTAEPLSSTLVSRKPIWISVSGSDGVMIAPSTTSQLVVAGHPLHGPHEYTGSELERGLVLELANRLVLLLHRTKKRTVSAPALGFVGQCDALESMRHDIVQAAQQAAPVLLLGETGVGKELTAQALHQSGPRKEKPFICVNMAAIPTATATSELFGHKKGSFTGAINEHPGYFGLAHGGSLFLDEIGATPSEIQALTLRAIETGEIQAVGSKQTQKVDVRIIAATDEDLQLAIDQGRFRAPLLHRLSAYCLTVPPLRDRREDISNLLLHFIRAEIETTNAPVELSFSDDGQPPWIPSALVADIIGFDWPGNVRQLINFSRYLVGHFGSQPTINREQAMAHLTGGVSVSPVAADALPVSSEPPPRTQTSPSQIDEEQLIAAMEAHQYRIGACAKTLGISRNSLYSLMERSGRFRKAKDIPDDEILSCHRDCDGKLNQMVDRLKVSVRALKLRLRDLGLE